MIFDTIKNCEMYYSLNENFKDAFDFLKKATRENLPVGKYEINGTKLYASVQEYVAKAPEDCNSEGHRNYIDIQYIMSGIEVISSFNIEKATLKTEYNAEKDVAFYENNEMCADCVVESGDYVILFPEDIHRPGMSFEGNAVSVKKIVVKVKI